MGAGSLSAWMNVQLEKVDCYTGESLEGKVNLSLNENLEAAALYLILEAKERYRLTTGEGEDQTTCTHSNKKVITEIEIRNWPEGFNSGSYFMPFIFKVPTYIQGTIWSQEFRNKGSVTYKLIIKLVDKKKKECHCEQNLIIKQRELCFTPNLSAGIFAMMRSCFGIINEGECFIKASIPKSYYYLNEVIQSKIELNNTRGQIPAAGVQVSLVREIDAPQELFSKTLEKFYTPVLGSNKQTIFLEIDLKIKNAANEVKRLPYSSGPSVKCEYFFIAKAVMTACCMSSGQKPRVKIPVFIFSDSTDPLPLPPPLPPPPKGWNPNIMNTVILENPEHVSLPEGLDSDSMNRDASESENLTPPPSPPAERLDPDSMNRDASESENLTPPPSPPAERLESDSMNRDASENSENLTPPLSPPAERLDSDSMNIIASESENLTPPPPPPQRFKPKRKNIIASENSENLDMKAKR